MIGDAPSTIGQKVSLLVLLLVLSGCVDTDSPAAGRGSEHVSPLAASSAWFDPSSEDGGGRFTVGRREAAQVAVLVAVISAYNAGDVDGVTAWLDPEVAWSDCDYVDGQAVRLSGVAEVGEWIRSRAAIDDFLEISSIRGAHAGTSAPLGLGVILSSRKNSDLRRLGVPRGIVPPAASSVKFTSTLRISAFAVGTGVGAPISDCRISLEQD